MGWSRRVADLLAGVCMLDLTNVLAGLELVDRRPGARADGQRQRHRGPLGHVPHRGGPLNIAANKQEQVRARGTIREVAAPAPLEGPLRLVRAGFRLASGDPGPSAPPPRLGEHTQAILEELGLAGEEIERLRARGVV